MLSLALKLTLAPGLVGLAFLGERRWGQAFAGWLVGFPIVAGPILFFYAWEQGSAFAARAAAQALLGLVSLSSFGLAYGWISLKLPPTPALLLGWLVFALPTAMLRGFEPSPAAALAAALTSLAAARQLLPSEMESSGQSVERWRWELPARMAATAALVLVLTGLAAFLGPALSGLLTPFPVASTVVIVAAHQRLGSAGAVRVVRGLLAGLVGFALFCTVLSYSLSAWGIAPSFGLALLASALTQAVMLRWL